MLIEIHMIQNHSPANMNRDDLGAPKTCYFGGVLRSRISSQCLKRSIRRSKEFEQLCGGIRTRQLAKLIAGQAGETPELQKRAEKILDLCGIKQKAKKGAENGEEAAGDKSKMLVYTTRAAIAEMAQMLSTPALKDEELAISFGRLISKHTAVPDMALTGRMLETGVIEDTTVEAALQVAHAFSTHTAHPEVDYYVAADDIPGTDAGAGYVDEAMFASACFYKYFSINWEQLVHNLNGDVRLAAHTVGAFVKAAAYTTPTGKQNSYAAHNLPDGVAIEIKPFTCSYANAFADPVTPGQRGLIEQSIAQLGQYMHDIDTGYGKPEKRLWFSPNLRHHLDAVEDGKTLPLAHCSLKTIEELIPALVAELGYDWADVQQAVVSDGAQS